MGPSFRGGAAAGSARRGAQGRRSAERGNGKQESRGEAEVLLLSRGAAARRASVRYWTERTQVGAYPAQVDVAPADQTNTEHHRRTEVGTRAKLHHVLLHRSWHEHPHPRGGGCCDVDEPGLSAALDNTLAVTPPIASRCPHGGDGRGRLTEGRTERASVRRDRSVTKRVLRTGRAKVDEEGHDPSLGT